METICCQTICSCSYIKEVVVLHDSITRWIKNNICKPINNYLKTYTPKINMISKYDDANIIQL